MSKRCDKIKKFIVPQKVAKKWLPVEIDFPIQDSVNYPVIFNNCVDISICKKIRSIIYRSDLNNLQTRQKKKLRKKYQLVGIVLSINGHNRSLQT